MNLEKKLEKLIGQELNEETAILGAALLLVSAQKVAEFNSDIDALVAISERWMALSKLLSEEDQEAYGSFGFRGTNETKEDDLDESDGQGNNESTSRIKVRKKSR